MEVAEAPEVTVDIAFKPIGGDGVSLLSSTSTSSSNTFHPARALAVSNRFGLTFFATPSGFGVVKTVDAVELCRESKPASSVSEKCLASLELDNVWILELSKDDLTLAVCAGGAVRFYRVPSLALKTEAKPFEIRTFGGNVKDFQWCSAKKYLILSSTGKLLIGEIGEEPVSMKNDVSAACWSQSGKQIAYSTALQLTIASSDFAKSTIIDLPLDFPGCEEGLETKVDALRWISAQSMLVSYVQSDDDEEVACPLLVLSTAAGQLDEACTKWTTSAVSRMFPAIEPTIIPSRTSPYMLVQNLEPWKLVVATCRRSIDAHVGILGWDSEGFSSFEVADNSWRPVIPMFESSSDNALTGLAIDRTSTFKPIDPRAPEKFLPPSPIVLCTSLDCRLLVYSLLRLDGESWYSPDLITTPSNLEEMASKSPDTKVDGERKVPSPTAVVTKATKTPIIVNGVQPRPFSASKSVNEQLRRAQIDLNQKEPPQLQPVQPVPPQVPVQSPQMPVQTLPPPQKKEEMPPREMEKRPIRPAGISEMEANFLTEMNKVKRIVEDVDGFMYTIEKSALGSSGLTRSGVEKLENEMSAASARCRDFKQKLQENCHLVEELRDQSLEVDAWRIYVESRVEQAADSRYQDLWVHRKLHPEMEVKRKHVINADERLKKKISELEAHLHTLEISQRQNTYPKQSGHFQSVQSLYSTVNSQMEAADKICLHLADLMELMNISSSATSLRPRKLHSSSTQTKTPPQVKPDRTLSTPSKAILSDDFAAPESTRRRRDSLDNAVGVTKTTIKRTIRPTHLDRDRKTKLLETVSNIKKSTSTQKLRSVSEGEALALAPAAAANGLTTLKPIRSSFAPKAAQPPPFGDSAPKSQPAFSLIPSSTNALALKAPDVSRASSSETRTPAFSLPGYFSASATIANQVGSAAILELKTSPFATSSTTQSKAVPDSGPFKPLELKATSISSAPRSLELESTSKTLVPKSTPASKPLELAAPPTFKTSEPKPIQGTASLEPKSTPVSPTSDLKTTPFTPSEPKSTPVSPTSDLKITPFTPPEPKSTPVKDLEISSSPTPSSTLFPQPSSVSNASSPTTTVSSSVTPAPPMAEVKASAFAPASASPPFSFSIPAAASKPQSTTQPTTPPATTTLNMFGSSPSPFPAAPASSPFPALLQSQQQQYQQQQQQQQQQQPSQAEEDDMDEEGPSTSMSGTSLSGFGGLGLGSAATPPASAPNPFGITSSPQGPPFGSLPAPPPGQLFKPAAFSLSSPSTGFSLSPESGAFSKPAALTAGAFGQPSSGFGQAAAPAANPLGSALGAFGQTRQVGFGTPSHVGSGFGSGGGGFGGAPLGGGFASAASGNSFGSAAAVSGGGFAGAAGGGFQAFGSGGGGGGGGGFGAFAASGGGTPGFGSAGGFATAQPSNSPLFTAMRK